jgi:hypothetical protein
MEKNKKVLIGVVLVFVIIITIAIFKILQPAEQPTIEEANIILAESIQNTLGLDSFTTTGDGVFKIKDGEVTLFRVALKDIQISAINPFDFANRDLRGVYTYNFLMDFYAIANFIERMEVPDEDMSAEGIARKTESLRKMREMGEINFSVTMEMKSIDLDSYIKITKIEGLEEMLYSFAVLEGPVEQPEDIVKKLAKITEKIEPHLGIWYKIPVDPETKEGMKEMGEASAMFKELMKKFAGVIYVEEVFENTKINEVPVYNFARGVDLDKAKNTLIDWVIKEMDIAEAEADKGRTKLAVGWQKIRPIFETIKMNSRTYICQETRFIKKETALTSLNLAELITAIRSAIPEMLIDEDGKVAFDKMKDSFGSINIVMTMNFVYSEHNAVAPILPPAEYQYLEKILEKILESLLEDISIFEPNQFEVPEMPKDYQIIIRETPINGPFQGARDAHRMSAVRQLSSVLAIEVAMGVNAPLTGCVTADAATITCTGPGTAILREFARMVDPKHDAETDICGAPGVTGPCQFGISNAAGDAGARTDDYQICFYLEVGAGGLDAGFNSIRNGVFHTGCK